jgi:hypothetical protein
VKKHQVVHKKDLVEMPKTSQENSPKRTKKPKKDSIGFDDGVGGEQ